MMRDIGKNIRELRLRAGFSQDELAERLFVTRQTVSNYENGRTRPDVEQILHLAEIFGADANAVLYGPRVPASRRRAISRAVVGGGMTAMLWTGFLLLRRWVTALVTYNYQILPGVILSVCWKPLMWGVTGWTLSQLLSLVISIKPPKTVGAHRARLILIIIAFGGILLSVIDCVLVFSTAYRVLPLLLQKLFSLVLYFSLKSSFIYPFLGIALRLLGFPSERDASPDT